MRSRIRTRSLGPLAALLGVIACGAPLPVSVLLVTLDTTRADRIGAYGWQAAETPRLDRLAQEGVLFELAMAPTPITLPSHTSILTGVAPAAHGVRDNGLFALGPDAELVSEAFRERGWRTGAFVGSFVLNPSYGLDQGFEVYHVPERPPGREFEPYRPANAVVDDALAWLSTLRADEPFFAWVHFFDPHYPYDPPEPWRSRTQDLYDGEIAFSDYQLGRLLDGISRRGLARNLLVAVTADHGESTGEHGERSHGVFVYQATLRVPLLLAGPPVAVAAGARVRAVASLLELPATLLALAGLPPDALPRAASTPLPVPGLGFAERPASEVYVESLLPYYSFRWRAYRGIVAGGYKLIDGSEPELYALQEDPGELRDLAAEQPERVARMRARLVELEGSQRSLGWAEDQAAGAGDRARLRALGYVAGEVGDDPFAEDLPDPRERLPDLELVFQASNLLTRASQLRPLEPGAFRREPGGPRVSGRRFVMRARQSLIDLRARNPRDPHAWVELGTVESLIGHYERAIPLLERGIELQPRNPALRYHLAHAYQAQGRPREALRSMRAAETLDPDDARYSGWLAERETAAH